MEPDPGQLSASFAGLSLSIGPVSVASVVASTITQAPSGATTSMSSLPVSSTTSTQPSSTLSSGATTVFSTTPSSQSSSSQGTTSLSSASASTRMSSNPSGALYADKTGFKVGVSFGALATLGLLVALVSWWLRMRQRTRTRALENSVVWPWAKETPSDLPRSPAGLETGFGAHASNGDGANVWSAGCLDRLDAISPTDGRLPTLPPAVHSLNDTPYQTVQLHHTNSSVPDLAPNMGALQVTNLVPGDITSGSESSRASSVLSMAFVGHTPMPECGTPYEPMAFLGAQDNGLPVPWAPFHAHKKTTDFFRLKSSGNISEKSVGPLPYPGDIDHGVSAQGSWAASIKTNLVHAFNAVVGGPTPSNTAADHLTTSPRRKKRDWKHGADVLHYSVDTLSRGASIRSSHSDVKEWPPEEVEGNAYLTHQDAPTGGLPEAHSWASIPLEDEPQKSPQAEVKEEIATTAYDAEDNRLDIIEEYYAEQAFGSPSLHVDADPPRLPDIPQVSHTPSLSSLAIVCEGRSQRKSTKYRKSGPRKKTRGSRRPTLVTRKSSSACSVGSDMSRQSSVCSERLTDGEAFAKRMLRERRRRVMEMGAAR
ncbi:uncharacterized protein B0H18DRAFT_996857 [Fomitopsis serialis]|uniref:uncharacterized protein n=1 Tax=Fomitopsis serialis TaxID=139415 RepID=UPI002008AD35|nr:uncharacterized protein B0H18DRAFT_996857 [Neoantrodia serialis]KAH9929381.1 hypothetical protein B0H18DRAFT_996857 [Neoantrodia serialis]